MVQKTRLQTFPSLARSFSLLQLGFALGIAAFRADSESKIICAPMVDQEVPRFPVMGGQTDDPSVVMIVDLLASLPGGLVRRRSAMPKGHRRAFDRAHRLEIGPPTWLLPSRGRETVFGQQHVRRGPLRRRIANGTPVAVPGDCVEEMSLLALGIRTTQPERLVDLSPGPVLEEAPRLHHLATHQEFRAGHVFTQCQQAGSFEAELVFFPNPVRAGLRANHFQL